MHVLSANTAALAYPNCKSRSAYTAIGKLNGLGGNIGWERKLNCVSVLL